MWFKNCCYRSYALGLAIYWFAGLREFGFLFLMFFFSFFVVLTVFEFILLKRYSWFSKCLEFFCALRCYSVGVLRCQGVWCFGVNSVSKGSGFEGVTNPNPLNIRRSVISIKVVGLVMTASHFVVDVT